MINHLYTSTKTVFRPNEKVHRTHWRAIGELESKQVKKGDTIAASIAVTAVEALFLKKKLMVTSQTAGDVG